MTDNLDLIYRYCVYHLDSVNNKIPDVHFEFDGTQKWLCSRSLPKPLSFSFSVDPITDAPLIFQVIGQISERKEPVVNQHFQEIWIEGRSDAASRALWSHIPDSLNAISEAAHLSFNLSKLFEVDDHSGVVRLRVVWTPTQANNTTAGIDIDTTRMPVFIRGHPGVLQSLLDSQAVQVLFRLVHGAGHVVNGELYLQASLLSLATV